MDLSVGSVSDADVIHASKADLGKIFRVMTSQFDTGGGSAANGAHSSISDSLSRQYILLMAETSQVCPSLCLSQSE